MVHNPGGDWNPGWGVDLTDKVLFALAGFFSGLGPFKFPLIVFERLEEGIETPKTPQQKLPIPKFRKKKKKSQP